MLGFPCKKSPGLAPRKLLRRARFLLFVSDRPSPLRESLSGKNQSQGEATASRLRME